MHKYIEELTELISNCPMDNTYKMSWCKALVEYSCNHSDKKVHFDKLSELMFKYYWDQTIFFNLEQGSKLSSIILSSIILPLTNPSAYSLASFDKKPSTIIIFI